MADTEEETATSVGADSGATTVEPFVQPIVMQTAGTPLYVFADRDFVDLWHASDPDTQLRSLLLAVRFMPESVKQHFFAELATQLGDVRSAQGADEPTSPESMPLFDPLVVPIDERDGTRSGFTPAQRAALRALRERNARAVHAGLSELQQQREKRARHSA